MAIYLTPEYAGAVLPHRAPNSHKGHYGRLCIVAGSTRYRGAALLAADAALRCGAGIVQLAAIEAVCAAAAVRLPACTLLPLPAAESGGIAPEGADMVLGQKASAMLVGCGLGATGASAALLLRLLRGAACPLVLDADALNLIAGHGEEGYTPLPELPAALAVEAHPVVITPHVAEMARLCDESAEYVAGNMQQVAQAYAKDNGCVVVLKSHRTVVATPQGEVYINEAAGGPGLAKGGSGDVLAGTIASLLAQGLPAEKAAAAGVWLHAAAGDAAVRVQGQAGLSVAELPQFLAEVLHTMGR